MKVLFSTDRTPAVSKDMGDGRAGAAGVAWFELVLHEGPADENTWEGDGNTVAYWRTQFTRLRNPHPWTVNASGVAGVSPAVIPDEIVTSLPDDARITFVWTFVPSELERNARSSAATGATVSAASAVDEAGRDTRRTRTGAPLPLRHRTARRTR